MQSIFTACDGQEIQLEYDLPGTRYWLVRTDLAEFRVFGWIWVNGHWLIREYRNLSRVFFCTNGREITAKSMIDGGRAVISAVQREAA
jgi:hypothetical protein